MLNLDNSISGQINLKKYMLSIYHKKGTCRDKNDVYDKIAASINVLYTEKCKKTVILTAGIRVPLIFIEKMLWWNHLTWKWDLKGMDYQKSNKQRENLNSYLLERNKNLRVGRWAHREGEKKE